MTRYALFRVDEDDERRDRIGDVELDGESHLSVVAAEPDARDEIDEAIEDLNGREALIVKLPGGAGSARFSIRKQEVPRADPGFFEAMQDNLRRWHNMELVAE